ncbi:MAG: hypothetical protein V4485_03115, partial [Pseudomonadota bacterium]
DSPKPETPVAEVKKPDEPIAPEIISFCQALKHPFDSTQTEELIERAFDMKNQATIQAFVQEIISAHNLLAIEIFVKKIIEKGDDSSNQTSSESFINTDSPKIIQAFVKNFISIHGANRMPESEQEIIYFISRILPKVSALSVQSKIAFLESVMYSRNPIVVAALVTETQNIECAKESIAQYLFHHLRHEVVLNLAVIERISADIQRMIYPVVEQCTDEDLMNFAHKVMRKSAKELGVALSINEIIAAWVDRAKELFPMLATPGERGCELRMSSNAIAEIVKCYASGPNKRTPSQVIGDNTRKRAARVL